MRPYLIRILAVLAALWPNLGWSANCVFDAVNSAQFNPPFGGVQGLTGGNVSLTTSHGNDAVCVFVANTRTSLRGSANSVAVSTMTSPHYTWTLRSSPFQGADVASAVYGDFEYWCTQAASPLSSEVVTWTYPDTVYATLGIIFAFNGVVAPPLFDTNGSLPASNSDFTNTLGTPTVTGVSTSNAVDTILGICGNIGDATCSSTSASGFATLGIQTAGGILGNISAAISYKNVTSIQSGASFATSSAGVNDWFAIGDALQACSPPIAIAKHPIVWIDE